MYRIHTDVNFNFFFLGYDVVYEDHCLVVYEAMRYVVTNVSD